MKTARLPLFSRRNFLRRAGQLSLALPWLEATSRSAHAAGGAPERFVVFFSPGGTVHDSWRPTGTETSFTLPYILNPLEKLKHRLMVLDGLEMKTMADGVGHPHQRGMATLLTGHICPSGPFKLTAATAAAGFPKGVSLDQVIGARKSQGKRFKTLEFGVLWPTYGKGAAPENVINFLAPEQPSPPMGDPWSTWQRLFGSARSGPGEDLRGKRAKLVLDSAGKEYAAVGAKLGMEDRRRLEAHLERYREIANALESVPLPTGGSCKAPEISASDEVKPYRTGGEFPVTTQNSLQPDVSPRMPAVGKLMTDLLVMSLACDLTRVATLQWADSLARNTLPWLNLNDNHHRYQHNGGYQPEKLIHIYHWYMEQLAYLGQRLEEVRVGDRSLLETTVVFAGSEISYPNEHGRKDMPFLLMTGASGFRTGRWVRPAGRPHNDLLAALQNAFGIEGNTFGDAKYCTGPLDGLA